MHKYNFLVHLSAVCFNTAIRIVLTTVRIRDVRTNLTWGVHSESTLGPFDAANSVP